MNHLKTLIGGIASLSACAIGVWMLQQGSYTSKTGKLVSGASAISEGISLLCIGLITLVIFIWKALKKNS
jgi:hypothetical protein